MHPLPGDHRYTFHLRLLRFHPKPHTMISRMRSPHPHLNVQESPIRTGLQPVSHRTTILDGECWNQVTCRRSSIRRSPVHCSGHYMIMTMTYILTETLPRNGFNTVIYCEWFFVRIDVEHIIGKHRTNILHRFFYVVKMLFSYDYTPRACFFHQNRNESLLVSYRYYE